MPLQWSVIINEWVIVLKPPTSRLVNKDRYNCELRQTLDNCVVRYIRAIDIGTVRHCCSALTDVLFIIALIMATLNVLHINMSRLQSDFN